MTAFGAPARQRAAIVFPTWQMFSLPGSQLLELCFISLKIFLASGVYLCYCFSAPAFCFSSVQLVELLPFRDSCSSRGVHVGLLVRNYGIYSKYLHGIILPGNETITIHQVFMAISFCASAIVLIWITKVAKATLEKALAATNAKMERFFAPSMLAIVSDSHSPMDAEKPLLIMIDLSGRKT
ncbi:hypothetical protein V6N13_087230 [Hibiscus sabdariffa]|uniref:Uncharacterized protein n=1 Tax=Hibiscus sabdariffa TaxID=183260 RepID=A0ABR2FVM3_9ROSI